MQPFLTSKNRKLRISLAPLGENADEMSELSAAIVASDPTFSVLDANKFAVNKILLIGELGTEQSEIVKTNASTGPLAGLITLVTGTSTTNLTPSVASKTFTTQSGLAIQIGDRVRATSDSNSAIYMEGLVTSYSGTTLIVSVDTIGTASAKADWTIRQVCRYSHPVGTKVYMIQYDQIELTRSTTVTGSKTALTTTIGTGYVALEADEKTQVYDETEYTSGYYFGRFRNSIAGTFGDYCDAVPYGGFTEDTAGYVIDHALKQSGIETFTDVITPLWCYDQLTEMLRYVQGKQKRWNKYQNLNAILTQTVRGTREITMPADIYDPNSNRSLTGIRVGDGVNLVFKDPDEFEEMLWGQKETEVATQQTSGGTTLVVDNAYDFEDSGTITFFISGVKYDVTYTSITRSTGTFNGIPASGDGSISVTVPVDTKIYQNYQEGQPIYYTVRNQKIEILPMPSDIWDNKNVYGDYWTIATSVNSDSDSLDVERADMAKKWLTWKMRCMKKNEGKLDYEDGDYKMFADILKDAVVFKGGLMKHKMMPKVNGISYRGYGRTRRRTNGE